MIIFLDSNIIVYEVEEHPVFEPKVAARLGAAQAAGDRFIVSDLIRMECLIKPIRDSLPLLESDFRAFFSRPDVAVVPINPRVTDRAAHIRAATGFRALDSLHLAAAIEHGAGLFLTHDARLNRFTQLSIEILQ